MGNVSTMDISRSPFVRAHRESFAVVAAAVARRMAVHCNRRRKTGWVDGLVGYRTSWPFTPLAGVPLERGWEGPDRTVRVCPGQTVSFRRAAGRSDRRIPLMSECDLARLLRAIDRQMRIDWDFGHPLKEQTLPRYLQKMVTEESQAQHEREEEAERRRFKVDLSKLGGIRSAAAVTREALLVDEEREGYVPGDAAASPRSRRWRQSLRLHLRRQHRCPHRSRPRPTLALPRKSAPFSTRFSPIKSRLPPRGRPSTCLSTQSTRSSLTSWETRCWSLTTSAPPLSRTTSKT